MFQLLGHTHTDGRAGKQTERQSYIYKWVQHFKKTRDIFSQSKSAKITADLSNYVSENDREI